MVTSLNFLTFVCQACSRLTSKFSEIVGRFELQLKIYLTNFTTNPSNYYQTRIKKKNNIIARKRRYHKWWLQCRFWRLRNSFQFSETSNEGLPWGWFEVANNRLSYTPELHLEAWLILFSKMLSLRLRYLPEMTFVLPSRHLFLNSFEIEFFIIFYFEQDK